MVVRHNSPLEGDMKNRLAMFLCAGLLVVPAVSSAQEDFRGTWEVDMSTPISDSAVSPFAAAQPPVAITQTADTISWETADGRQLQLRLNEPSMIAGRTYTARRVNRALLLEARSTRPDGRSVTMLQILLRNANDELELLSFLPLPRSNERTEIGRLVYKRRK
jgi:hypothetical protein